MKHLSTTKGIIAVKGKKGWQGVYNHYDSYPSGLGQAIWDKIKWYEQQGMPLQDAIQTFLASKVKDVPQGYSKFPDKPFGRNEPAREYTNKTANPILLEWVYIIDPVAGTMRIMHRIVKQLGEPIPPQIWKQYNAQFIRQGIKWLFRNVVLWHSEYAKVDFRDAQFNIKDPE